MRAPAGNAAISGVASTKPEAASTAARLVCLHKGEGWALAPRDRGQSRHVCRQGHSPYRFLTRMPRGRRRRSRTRRRLPRAVRGCPSNDDRDRILARGEELRTAGAVERSPSSSRSRSACNWLLESLNPSRRLTASCSFSALRRITCRLLLRFGRISSTPYPNVPRSLVDVIADVVDSTRQQINVITVERRDEGAIEEVDDLACEAVAFVLQLFDLPQVSSVRREPVKELDELARDPHRVVGCVLEEPKEACLFVGPRDGATLLSGFDDGSLSGFARRGASVVNSRNSP